jgi:hypothetical protein
MQAHQPNEASAEQNRLEEDREGRAPRPRNTVQNKPGRPNQGRPGSF